MHSSSTTHISLMSAPAVKRWGWRFLVLWIGMWLSTALLPCNDVLAAVAIDELALRAACGHPADKAPIPAGNGKTGACVSTPAPVRVSAVSVAAPSFVKSVDQAAGVATPHRAPSTKPVLAPHRVLALEAPPPPSFHSRSSRLLL